MVDQDLREALRGSLAMRADDVAPSPDVYPRVQERIRRHRTVRYGVAGVVAVTCLVLVATALPRLLVQPGRVEFEPAQPGPVAPAPVPPAQPRTDRTGSSVLPVPDTAFAWTDGTAVTLAVPGTGATGPGPYCPGRRCVRSLSVDPRSGRPDGHRATAAYRIGDACDAQLVVVHASPGLDGVLGIFEPRDGCVRDPVFSPDGSQLAWFEHDPGQPRALRFHVADVDHDLLDAADGVDPRRLLTGEVVVALGSADDQPPDLLDWHVDDDGEYLVARRADTTGLTIVPLRRDATGPRPAPVGEWYVRTDVVGYDGADGVAYTLTARSGPVRLEVAHPAASEDPLTTMDVPQGFATDGSPWVTATAGGVLVGDGWRAWLVTPELGYEPIPGRIVFASLVGQPSDGTPPGGTTVARPARP